MMTILTIWKKIRPIVKNKYVITSFVFILWLSFFDQNNLIDRIKSIRLLNQLEKDKQYYKERIEKDTERLKQLRTDSKNLEKFAREQYLMKKDNEDVFVIVEDD